MFSRHQGVPSPLFIATFKIPYKGAHGMYGLRPQPPCAANPASATHSAGAATTKMVLCSASSTSVWLGFRGW